MFPSQVDSDASESGNTFDTYKKASHSNTTEVETYLSSRPENLGMTILKWWYANSESSPILSMTARDYLSVPATSASSERIFSGGVDLVTPNRCSLNSESITACMCPQSWLKNEKGSE